MTHVGKILVLVIMAFSLVFLGISTVVKTARWARAVRWSSRNLGNQPSLQALVRLDSQIILPHFLPYEFRTICTTSAPRIPLGTGLTSS